MQVGPRTNAAIRVSGVGFSVKVPMLQAVIRSLSCSYTGSSTSIFWVAVKELKLSYYIGEAYYLLYIYIPIMVT